MKRIIIAALCFFAITSSAFAEELIGEDPEQLLPVSVSEAHTNSYSDELAASVRSLKKQVSSAKKAANETADRVSIGNIVMGRKIEDNTKATTEIANEVAALAGHTAQNAKAVKVLSLSTVAGFVVFAILLALLVGFVRRNRKHLENILLPVAQDISTISRGVAAAQEEIAVVKKGVADANTGIATSQADLVGVREEVKNSFRRALEEIPRSAAEAVRTLGEEERTFEISGKKITIIPEKSRTGAGLVSLKVGLDGKRQVVNENVFDLDAEEVLEKFILGEYHRKGAGDHENQKKVFSNLKEKGRITIEVI